MCSNITLKLVRINSCYSNKLNMCQIKRNTVFDIDLARKVDAS